MAEVTDVSKWQLLKKKILSYKNPRDIGAIIIILVVAFFVMQAIINENNRKSFEDVGYDYSKGWVNEKGKEVVLEELDEMDKLKIGGKYVIKKKISKKDIDIAKGESLCFLTKNISIKCYIDGKKVYETKIQNSILDTASPGSNWNFYKFKDADIGKVVEIHATRYFMDDSASIKFMRIADEREYAFSYIYEHLFILAVYVMMLGLALVLIVCGMVFNDRKDGGICELLMSLGGTLLTLTTWLVIDTRVLSLFFNVNSLFQAMSVACLYLVAIPVGYVIKNLFKLETTKTFRIIVRIGIVVNIVVWTLHMLNVFDIHDSLPFCHVYLIGMALAYIINVAYEYRKRPKTQDNNSLGTVVKIVGIVVLLLGIVIDIARYKKGLLGVGVSFIQVDILLVAAYCISISFGRILDMNVELKQNEVISKLAYQDGLTGVHNRTAYMEKLEDIRNNALKYEKIGIVAFDVNNLKTVNDVYGHAEGDKLINTAAELIGRSFVENCEEYRIGGDEFVVIINSHDADKIYKMGIVQLTNSIQNYNNFYHKDYKVSVAVGVAFCDSKDIEKCLDDVLKEADTNMYKEKEKMKKEL